MMWLPLIAQAATSLQLAEVPGVRGAVVDVPVSLLSDVAITEVQFDLRYDPQHYIVAGTVNPGVVLSSTQHKVSSSELGPGSRRVVISAPIPSAPLNTGVIAHVPFLVYASAAPGTLLILAPAAKRVALAG